MTYTAQVGASGFDMPEMFNGQDGRQDTFVFSLGNYSTTGTTSSIDSNPGGWSLAQMGSGNFGMAPVEMDMVGNFDRADGDKIKIFDTTGSNPITSLASASLTSTEVTAGNWLLVTSNNDVVVGTTFEIMDADLTTV